MSLGPVYLVDASIYVFRAWYSVPDEFATAAGEPTNAVYGFTGFICSLLEQAQPSHIGIAFDHTVESFRNDLFEGYKTGEGLEPELDAQFHPAEEVCRALASASGRWR